MLTWILAAANEMTAEQYRRIIVASLVVIGLIVAAFVLVAQVRRRLRQDDTSSSGGVGFTLSDLRQLHKSGQMSDEEFERAKSKIVEAARRATAREAALGPAATRDLRQARAAAELETKPPATTDEGDTPPTA